MKKTTFLKVILLAFVFLQSFISYSQTLKPFTPRFDKDIKGDMLLIGNSILNRSTNNRTPNNPYNDSGLNSDFDMQFINIDNGATSGIFNSSSANLVVPNASAPAAPCYKILYAALYWGAVTKGTTPITNIKFKMPTGGYNDVVGTIIHDSGTNVIGTSYPYACYADVTSLVTGAGNPTPEGTYTVANVSSKVGTNRPANASSGGTGLSAGWSLFIVYEDPKLAAKSITSFDGFSAISSTVNLDIPVTGFRTIPTGPVRAKFAFSALEGDQGISGDYLTINSSILSAVNNAGTTIRGTNNFFNSSVTYIDPANGKTEDFINRNPASTNTLGYDAGILEINNNGNAVIKNNDISAVIGLRSNQDVYFYYFNAISLEIIEPKIVLTKQVFSDATLTNNIGNANVTLGQELFYAIGFQNIGNDDAENFTIKDILPININFDPNNIIVPNGSGITYVYNAATRTIVFTVPKDIVEKNDPRFVIKFKVQVVPECNDLSDACSDKIQNQAFATYVGVTSDIKVDDQLSLSTFGECYLGTASPTNFLVGVENCIYTKDYQLCGASVVLTAANGYNSYSWSTSATGTPVIGTTQSITVSQTGTYYVTNIANAPCRSIKQVVTVSPSGTTVQNPVIPFADQVVQCPNNGKDLPKIFLCGANATRLINTGVTDAISIVWQKLNEASCTAIGTDDCANEKVDCTWDNIASGPSYTANTSGQFRVVFNYAGGCFNIFYFNVFKNLLNPTATSRDIICNTSGEIIVGGVPTSGYEFSLSASGPFQDSNVFSITTANTYTVYIRQKGIVSNPCLFSVPGIDILQRNFTVSEFISQPLCNGDKGSIKLAANDVRAQYFYSIRKSGSLVNAVGPIAASDHTFSNLSPGSYDYEVKTDDGCLKTGTIVLIEPDVLEATVNQTKALTCETGEITVYPIGGTAPYAYYVNGSTTAQYSAVVNTPTAGQYNIRVVDYNGCSTTTSITIAAVPTPVYNTTGTNVNCYGDTSGVINFNLTNANGYTVTYSIDNGLTYGISGVISNLAAGTYNTILKYSLNGVDCLEAMKVITITQPSTALTASAGVSELAGCGPAGEGKIRITNPQGGVPLYEYSFDNQASWSSVNEAYKAPGTYTVYIKDANGCIFAMPNIIIDPEPVAPVIDVNTPVDFNCDGTATSTVTINNPGTASFTYNYYLDGIINPNTTNPNTFLNVPPGPHTVKVEYNLVSVPTYSNLLKEDFGVGANTTSPGIAAAYCFHNLDITPSTCPNKALTLEDNQYVVTRGIIPNNSAWFAFRDHTSLGVNPNGRFLAVNIGGAAGANGILYSKVIKDIIPHQPVIVEAYLANLFRANFSGGVDPSFSFELVDGLGNVIAQQPQIPPTPNPTGIPPIPTILRSNNWELRTVSLNPGANTTLTFNVRSGSIQYSGNDAAIDDIVVYQLPKSCITTRSFTVVVPTGKAFTGSVTGFKNVTCNGLSNGEITIAAQNFDTVAGYQYSLDNGANWVTATTSPFTITGLAAAAYNVMIRPDATALPSCVQTIPQQITAPALVTVDASITTLATCTTGATITAVGGGGTPAYQYELRQVITGLESVVTAFNTNANFTNVPAGDYVVYVRDANTCISPVGKAISVIAPPALTASLATTTDYCYTTANPATLDVTVTGGTGPFTYKLDGNTAVSSALTSYSFANVTPATHTILVTDSNNCTYTISSIVIAPQIAFNVSLLNDLTCSDDASIGNEVVTNGNGIPYTYTVSYNSGTPVTVASFPYTATQAGNYVFTVTDGRDCPATSNTIVVTPKTTPSHSTAKTDITCNGLSNGTITVTASGGFTSAYSYTIVGPVSVTQTTNQFTNLPAGDYTVSITDSKGCPSPPTTVTIANPTPIATNATSTTFSCSTTNAPQSATITVAPAGGTGAYSYSYDNGATFGSNATLTVNNNGSVQDIQIVVKDANGCLSPVQTITLQPLNSPTNLDFSNAVITCTDPTTTVSVTAINGVGALTFLITGTTSGTASTNFGPITTTGSAQPASFPNLLPGNYTFRVTDANGCYYTESYTIAAVTPIAIAVNKTSDVLCQGGATGSGTYTVSGNATVGAYTFTPSTFGTGTLTKSGNVLTLSNVAVGTYTVRVTDDATGCFADGTIIINEPAAPLTIVSAVPTNFNCNNDNAQITVSATGGTTAYGYAAVPATTTAPTTFASSNVVTVDTTNETVLSWDVYVRDANGCTIFTTVTVTGDPAPGAPTVLVPNQCTATGSGFTIQVTAAAGSLAPLTYGIVSLTGAFQTGNTFTVAPGTYTVYVKDRNGCVSLGTAVTVAAQLTANAAVTKTLDCDPTNPDAIITTTISGGNSPFTYTVQKGTGTPSAPSAPSASLTFTTSVSNANADTYTFVITDDNGCPTTTTATVAPITNPTVAVASQVNVSCNGGADGSVTLTGSGGSGGYEYSDDNVTFVSSGLFNGLSAGSPYTFYVRDNKGCPGSVTVTITQPANALAASVTEVPFSCNTSNANVSGTVTINASAGTSPYTYSFNGGAFTSNNVLTLNDNGSNQPYTYAVQDAKGCPISGGGTLFRLNPPVIGTITSTPIYCAPAATTSTVTIPVTAGTGVGTLTYAILSPASATGNISGANDGIFTGLTSGNYTFRVTDANGCYDTESHFVAPVTPIVATATKLTDVDCNGSSTGSIRYNVSGFGTGTYSYTINGVTAGTGETAGTFDLTNRPAAVYTVVFTDDTTSCTATTTVTIDQPPVLDITLISNINANCDVPTSRVTVAALGGTTPYSYAFVSVGNTPAATDYTASPVRNLNPATPVWDVYVSDANGCTDMVQVTITSDPIPTVTASGSGCLGTAGGYAITAANTTTPLAGIINPIRYSINNGASYQTSNVFTVTTAGTYTITMIDGNGCIATALPVVVAPQLTLNAVLNKDITCVTGDEPARITLTPTGGSGTFTYTVFPSTGTFTAANVFTTTAAGNYIFTVTDTATSCTYTTTTAIVTTLPVNPEIDDTAIVGNVGVTQTAFINCNGDDTGAIAIAIDNTKGQSPFVFNVQRTAPTPQNYGTQTSGLSAGDYLITVTDAKGCTDTETITITEPTPMVIVKTVIPIQCNTGTGISKGSIIIDKITDGISTIGGSGGTAPYTYYVTGINGYNQTEPNATGTTSITFNVVDFGLYQIRVVDANGCTIIENDVLVASPVNSLGIAINSSVTCATGGSATVKITSAFAGVGPFHFNIYNGPGQVWVADGTNGWQGEMPASSKETLFTNLSPGVTYTFIVYDEDTKCYYYETSTIPVPSTTSLSVGGIVPKNITCTGSNDGNVSFDITNASGISLDYTYEIFEAFTNISKYVSGSFSVSGSSTITVPNIPINLPVGSYYVYIKETSGANAGCGFASDNFNIKESPILLALTATKIKKINCNEDGIIAAFASNGTAPYTYQYLLVSDPAPIASTAGWTGNTTFATSTTGNYIVYVKDAYGCIKSAAVTLDADAAPTVIPPAAPICYDGTAFTITFSGTVDPAIVGAATYSVNGSAFQASSSFTFNAADTYNLVIKDGNGCTDDVDYIVLPQLQLTPALTKVLDCNLPAPNATVTLTAIGGTTTYTYTITSGPVVNTTGVTSGIFTGLDAGTYIFETNDGACTATTTFVIDPIPATVLATPTVKNVSCNAGTDGEITINVTSGVGPYEYSLFDGVTSTAFQTGNTFTGLAAGTTYTVRVRNDRDCLETTAPITITEPVVLDATAAAAPNTTCSNTTVITVTASGGTQTGVGTGYTYNFNGLGYTSDNTFTVNNGPVATTTTISVRDANGCTLALPNVITPALTPPTNLSFAVTTAPTCPANTATVQVTATGGLGNLDFDIIAFNNAPTTAYATVTTAGSGTPASFGSLPPGDYTFQVTDENGCTYQELYTVIPVTPIAIVGALVNDITCNPANGVSGNGAARYTVTGVAATSTYSYTINSGTPVTGQTSPTIDLTSLGAGTYTVTVTDETTLCQAFDDVTITEPAAINFTTAPTKVFCTQEISQITVSALSGGTGVYQYAVLPGGTVTPPVVGAYSNNPVLSVDTNLTDLVWDVYVMDAKGCVAMQTVTVVSNAAPTIVAPAPQCYTGTPLTTDLSPITITTTYNTVKAYTLNGTVLATSIATFNGPGTYILGIKDDNGCEAFVNYTITNQLIAGAVLIKDLTCATPTAATVNVTISGGIAPFTVQTLIGGVPTGAAVTGVTGPVYTANPTAAGIYSFLITDSNPATCSVTTNTVEVTTPVTPSFTTVFTDATCNGDSNGTITVTPTAGVAPFTFALSGTGANTTGDATGNYSGLPAGSYTVVITDAKGCTSVAVPAIVIDEPIVVSATISVTTPLSCGTGNIAQAATVTAVPSGGNGSYQYNFNNQGWTPDDFYVTNTFGPVSVLVRDTNGCSFATAVSATVDALDPPTNMDISGTLIYCTPATSATSTVTINSVQDGVGPFTYQILTPTFNDNGTNVFSLLTAGDYLFQVTDSNGCTYQELYTVAPRVDIAVALASSSNSSCFTANNGSATFAVTNSSGNYSYVFDGAPAVTSSAAILTFNSLAPGPHILTLTDVLTGCLATAIVNITEPTLALDFTQVATNINCNVGTATITVTPVGGTPNYKYAVVANMATAPTTYVSGNQLTVDTSSGVDMVWDVYVMDANGCVDVETVTIQTDASPTIASAVATQCPSSTGTYDITVTATGFSPTTFQYSADGSNYQTGNIITVNAPGNYTIKVKDANGCPSIGVSVTIYEPLILSPIVDTPVSCANNDGIITVSTTGGSNSLSNYQYKIDGGTYPMATPFTGLAFGLHRVYVQDIATGCEVYVDIDLQEATPITGFALAKTEVTCNGGTDGTITATMDAPADGVNDNPVYTYVLSGTTTVTSTAVNLGPQDSPLFSGLAAGTYTVTVTSERGCTDDANITIVEPALIDVPTPTVVPFGCTTGNDSNFATITVSNVTGGSNTYLNYEFIKVGTPTNTQVQFGASNVYTEADLLGGSYIVNVYDDKGCIGTTTAAITIDPYIALDKVNVVIDQAITCNNLENITVSATIIGVGTTNLEYTLVDVIYDPITGVSTTGTIYPAVPNNNGIFTGLPVGNYLITVKNLDTNCEIQGVHYVNEPNTFDLTIDTVVDVTCFSGTDGSVNVTFVDRLITTTPVNGDDAGAFTYTLEDAFGMTVRSGTAPDAGPITISGLAAGTYTITATLSQSPSCAVIKNFTITGPTAALDITETHTEITCVTGNNDGTISVTATGGWPGGYEFELVGPTAAQNVPYSAQTEFTGLTAGTYTINVRDSKGCVDFIAVTLADPAPIVFTATPSTTLVSCFGDTSATITAGLPTGGSGNYLYSLVTTYPNGTVTTDGPQVSNTFTNLGAGSYQVQVSDSWTCSALSAAIVITEPAKVTASLALATAISCDFDATLTLTASGGTAPYEYSTTSTFGTVIAMTGNTATFSVLVGTYNYYIRDINGCESFISNDITIDKVPDLVIDVNIQNAVINCKGDDSGVIVATAQGGLGDYVYTLLDGTGNALSFTPVQTSPGNFTNLPAGSYLVNVVSMDCEARTVVPVIITEPDFPLTESNAVTNITCAGEGDGKIVITASGGTGIIKYAISPDLNQFFESNVFDNLKPGSYDYIVQDENGCFIYTTGVVISEPNSIFVTTIPGTEMPEVCAGDADGAFSINVTGGNAPYSVSLDDVNGTYTPGTLVQTQFDFTSLSGSEHVVYVRDANNCTTEHTVILGEAVTLNPQATLNYDCVSNSASNSVTVTVDASNMPADLDYALDGSIVFQASNVFTNLTPGRHTIDVRHSNGCIKQVVFDVLQVDPLTLTLADGGLNEIVATATGGGGNYQYTLDGESYGTQSNFIIYKSGDYTVTVTDANGCTATATRYFEFIDIKIPNVFTPNGDGNNDTWAPTNTINYKDLVFYVYDRYGRKLGSYRESQFWDGKYNGNELPSGDYWYVIKIRDAKDAREFVGHFTLYR